jgi:hypothetical protein
MQSSGKLLPVCLGNGKQQTLAKRFLINSRFLPLQCIIHRCSRSEHRDACGLEWRHPLQNLVRHRPRRAHRLVLSQSMFQRYVTEYVSMLRINASHIFLLTQYRVELK